MERKRSILPPIQKKGITWNDDTKVMPIEMSEEEMSYRESVPISSGFVNNTGRKDSLILYLPELRKFQERRSKSLKNFVQKRRQLSIFEEDSEETPLPPVVTHRTKPPIIIKPFIPFPKQRAESLINMNLRNFTQNFFRYTPYNKKSVETVKAHLKELSDKMKNDIKRFCGERFRVVIHCAIGEIRQQDVIVASRHLLEQTKDVSICLKIVKDNVFIIVNMYAVYKE